MMSIRSLSDFNGAPWVGDSVTVGAITVTAQGQSSRSTHEPAERGGDFYLATSGDLHVATSGDFLMAIHTGKRLPR